MVTLNIAVQDCIEDLKQTVDDREISYAQVAYWWLIVADRLRSQHIIKQGIPGQERSGAFLTSFLLDVANEPAPRCRKYVTLPGQIYDYALDGAIDYMTYYDEQRECDGCPPMITKVLFSRTTPTLLHALYSNPFQAPSSQRPVYMREGNKLILTGPGASVTKVEIGLFLSLPSLTDVDPDAPLDIPADHVALVKRHVLELGRFALAVPGERLENDGVGRAPTDGGNPQNTPKMVSVNDSSMQQ